MGYSQKGTLEEWQNNVAEYAKGNSILIFVLCAALAPVLLKLIPELGTMVFHLVGPSSIGKTTALRVAASVWGKPKDYIKTWRATGNAQECLAESHNDGLLILDEMGQASGYDIGNTVYMIGNEQGKSRMNADSSFRELKEWKEICLSSGEIKLTEKLEEGKTKVHDGMLVRLIDVNSDSQKGMGIFEYLPNDIKTPCDLSKKLSISASTYYGVVAEEFVKYVLQRFDEKNFQITYETSLEGLKQWMIDNEGSSKGNDGKVLSVLQMFAFVHAVGIEAGYDGAGILPYNTDEIDISIKQIIKRCDLRNDADKNREILKYVQETLMSSNNILPIKPFRDERDKTIELTGERKAGYGETYGYSQEDGHYYLYGKYFGKLFCDKYGVNEVKKVLKLASVIKLYEEKDGSKKNQKFSVDGIRVSLMHLHFFGGGE